MSVLKKFFKWLLIFIGVLAILLAIAAIWWRSELSILLGADKLSGKKEVIPSANAKIKPLTNGQADWICWRGSNGDSRSPVTGIRQDWTGGLKKLWEVNFLCQGSTSATWSAPVIQGNRLVVCGRNKSADLIFCLDPVNGEILWQESYKTKAKSNYGSGPRATPYIDNDYVYTFGRSGDLICWQLLDGKLIWHCNVNEEGGKEPTWGHCSSPLILNQLVIVQAGGSAGVIAYNKMDGKVVWKNGPEKAGYAALVPMNIQGTPAILSFYGQGLMALATASGKKLWDIPWKTDYDVNAVTPLVHEDTIFITSGYGTGGALIKVSDKEAKILWINKVIAPQHSDPHIIDGFIYSYSGQSFQNKGVFKCVDLKTGTEKWSTSEMGWGTCTFVDGHLFCCDIKGNLFLFKPDPQKFDKTTEFPNALGKIKGPVWTVPVIANDRVYLRFNQHLVCYDLINK